VVCLWYGSFRRRTLRVILVRDNEPFRVTVADSV
jgi:hypothetical protein